ncbi:MAG: peptidoglycan DD-metalloendopeptidase family protein [Gemmatimonadetes bacterium]|nr:peptidoglycan DD-metalloendopeptidase family protein [Gemmatimonadota bacterium]
MGATLLLWLAGGCSGEAVREFFGYSTPRERYEQALRDAGLHRTALGGDWLAAAAEALDSPVSVSPPYLEEGYLDPRQTTATAYRVSLRRGQLLEVTFESEPDTSYRIFIDLFRVPERLDAQPRHVTSADSLDRDFDYFTHRDGDYLVRIQPELLRGGRYSIRVAVKPSLHFPVYGRDATAIGSRYGDGRDGGRRRHEGLDIFAPRGTPVIAAAAGVVRSTRDNRLGGNVVWLRDEFGQTHYYAHLDTQLVRRGQRVTVGDTLGLVGNSGNARSTPPHLHFGLYRRGSYDPYPALEPLPTTTEDFGGNPNLIGRTVRVTRAAARLRLHPTARSAILAELPRHTPLQVAAGSGAWYRVIAPDGTVGFVAASLTEPTDRPIRHEVLAGGARLLTDPVPLAVAVDSVSAGAEVPVLAAFGEFLLVQGPSGRVGWLALD